jgi:prepilin-type N-terminal cleavage/methylation domain-containing protein
MHANEDNNRQGFTLVEMVIALTIFSVGILGLAATFGSMARAGQDREREIRNSAIMSNTLSVFESVPFEEIAAAFGPGSGRDQFWCDPAGEVWFAKPGDVSAIGEIEIFDEESGIPTSFAGLTFGLDLNGNGTVEAGVVSDYQILPVRVTVTFPNDLGTQPFVNEFFLRP